VIKPAFRIYAFSPLLAVVGDLLNGWRLEGHGAFAHTRFIFQVFLVFKS
jgi:hypothetical protein